MSLKRYDLERRGILLEGCLMFSKGLEMFQKGEIDKDLESIYGAAWGLTKRHLL